MIDRMPGPAAGPRQMWAAGQDVFGFAGMYELGIGSVDRATVVGALLAPPLMAESAPDPMVRQHLGHSEVCEVTVPHIGRLHRGQPPKGS